MDGGLDGGRLSDGVLERYVAEIAERLIERHALNGLRVCAQNFEELLARDAIAVEGRRHDDELAAALACVEQRHGAVNAVAACFVGSGQHDGAAAGSCDHKRPTTQ